MRTIARAVGYTFVFEAYSNKLLQQRSWRALVSLAAAITLSSAMGCARTLPFPSPVERSSVPFKVTSIDDPLLYGGENNGKETARYYWVAQPEWSRIRKVERSLKGRSVQELMKQPYHWTRVTENQPLMRVRKARSWVFLLFFPVPTGWNCFARPLYLSQTTFIDADEHPSVLTDSKDVEARLDDTEEEAKVECDQYDAIEPIYDGSQVAANE